jgi:hypothetical protein
MNGMKSLFVCVLFISLGNVVVLADAQAPDGDATSKPAPKVEQPPVTKPVLVEGLTPEKSDTSSSELCQCVNRDSSAATKRIELALAGPLHSAGFDYADRPLQDVVTQLGEEYGIPIQLNKTALEEAGIQTDTKVAINLHNISLRSALKLTLRTLQLTWVIQNEVLMITTKEDAEKDLDTCVYNVQGLVDDADPKSIEALIDVIVSCVSTDSWAENGGGQAEVRPLPSGLLIVSQTQAIQEEVSTLLNKIRKMREKVPLTKVGPHGYQPPPRPSSSGKSNQGGGSGGGGFGTGKRRGD